MKPVKPVRFKLVGDSLIIFRNGLYWRSIPLKRFYHLIENHKAGGKVAELVKENSEGAPGKKVGNGKVLIDDDAEAFL